MLSWFDNRSLILKNIQNFTIIITTDFTAGNTKKSDFSGIAVWAINANDDKYLIDLFLEQCTIQDQYEALFKMVSRWSNRGTSLEVGIEIDGQQQLNINRLNAMMIEKNIWFRYARQKGKSPNQIGIRSRGNGNKMDRLRNLLPDFELNRIKFPTELKDSPQMKEGLDELRKVSRSGIGSLHDDFCFIKGTGILMADGSTKAIEDIKKGDRVMTFGQDTLTTLAENIIITPQQEVIRYYLSDGSDIVCTPGHRVLTIHGWKAINTLLPSEKIITYMSTLLKEKFVEGVSVIEKKKLNRKMDVYNFEAKDTHNYILSNGCVVHNCDVLSQLSLIDYILPSGNMPSKEDKIVDTHDMWALGISEEDDYTDSEIF